MTTNDISELQARVASLEQQLEACSSTEEALRDAQQRAEQALSVLRHTEQRFRALFDSNVIGILEINRERVLDANESFLKMTGQSREAVLSGNLLWREMTPSKYRQMDDQAHERAVRDGSFAPFEKEFYKKDGSLLPVWVGGVLLSPAPDWTCMAFVLDLSERKILEEQFHSSQKLRSLGLLSGIIAHDFNNLLTTMIGNASFSLEFLSPSHPAYEPVAEVLRASKMASGLTEQLVGYSSKPQHKSQLLDMSKLVREIGDLIELPVSGKARMEWTLAPGLPPVTGDAYLIQQILMNLVINASDALGEGPGTIRIITHCRDYSVAELEAMTSGSRSLPAGPYVAIQVQDTGCGMTDEVKAKIFDPMFTTKPTGRGLGLASALGIVRSHRGAIDVKSAPGEGTTFVILLPAGGDGNEAAEVSEEAASLSGSGTVLIVDDEPSVRRLAEASLSRYGYSVLMAEDGREGVEMYRQQASSISLIIMDISMPVMNGEEALVKLLEITPNPPLLFSSGFSERNSIKGLENYPFLPKPYTSRELAEKVKQLRVR